MLEQEEEENSEDREDFFLPPTILEQFEKKEEVKVNVSIPKTFPVRQESGSLPVFFFF
jgi:hypothetical protein